MKNTEERTWQLIAEVWNEREAQRVLDELDASPPDDAQAAEMQAFFAQNDAKFLRKMRKKIGRRTIKTAATYAVRAAAVLIMCVGLIGGVCYAASSEIRGYVTHLVLNIEGKGGSLYLVLGENSILAVPEGWGGNYFPTMLPSDLKLDQEHSDFDWPFVRYRSPDDPKREFVYYEDDANTGIGVDTEDAIVEKMQVRGCEGIVIEKGDTIKVFWCEGTDIYSTHTRGFRREEVMYYIECIERIG